MAFRIGGSVGKFLGNAQRAVGKALTQVAAPVGAVAGVVTPFGGFLQPVLKKAGDALQHKSPASAPLTAPVQNAPLPTLLADEQAEQQNTAFYVAAGVLGVALVAWLLTRRR